MIDIDEIDPDRVMRIGTKNGWGYRPDKGSFDISGDGQSVVFTDTDPAHRTKQLVTILVSEIAVVVEAAK